MKRMGWLGLEWYGFVFRSRFSIQHLRTSFFVYACAVLYRDIMMFAPLQYVHCHAHLDHCLHVLGPAGPWEQRRQLHPQTAQLGSTLVDVPLAAQRLVRLGRVPLTRQ